MANTIVLEGHNIIKSFIDKAEAEKKYGFTLYQGGVVPGNQLRVVNIQDVDVEACCGTHHDNTAQVGYIKITKTKRISDGIVRIYFVSGKRGLVELDADNNVIHELMNMWGVERGIIVDTANRFFSENKKYQTKLKNQLMKLVEFQVKNIISDDYVKVGFIKSEEDNSQIYFSTCPSLVGELAKCKKGIIFYNENFIYGLFGDKSLINEPEFKKFCESLKGDNKEVKFKYACQDKVTAGKKNVVKDVYQISVFSTFKVEDLVNKFKELTFTEVI